MNQQNLDQSRFLQLWAMVLLYAKILDIRVKCSGSASFIRSKEQQAELYKVGRRGIPGETPTTDNDGSRSSSHGEGMAMDITIINDKGEVIYDEAPYRKIAVFWKSLGGRWGGDWTPKENWHYDLWTPHQ